MSTPAGHDLVRLIHTSIEWAALAIEVFAVAIIVSGVVVLAVKAGTVRYLFRLKEEGALTTYKHQLGGPLLLGLELLVAADVIRTVALEPTLANVAVLGVLVLIRTVLSWSFRGDGGALALAGESFKVIGQRRWQFFRAFMIARG